MRSSINIKWQLHYPCKCRCHRHETTNDHDGHMFELKAEKYTINYALHLGTDGLTL